jgi:hypothetical protein
MEEELSSVSCRLAHPDHIRGVSFSRGTGEIPMRAQHGTLAGAGPPHYHAVLRVRTEETRFCR